MKKQSKSRTLLAIKRILNFRQWADWDRMKAFTLYLAQGIGRLFSPKEPETKESFKAAISRLKLSQKELLAKKNGLLRLAVFMVTLAFIIFIYAVYNFFMGYIIAACLSFVVMFIALVLAFRYHFWYFQIQQQKLGCTIGEWFRVGILGEKKP